MEKDYACIFKFSFLPIFLNLKKSEFVWRYSAYFFYSSMHTITYSEYSNGVLSAKQEQ